MSFSKTESLVAALPASNDYISDSDWCIGWWYRDAYGFAVRPQHLQRYREYANIYKVV